MNRAQYLREMYAAVYDQTVDEARAPGVKPYKPAPTGAEVRADAAKAEKKRKESGKDKPGYGPEEKFKSDWKLKVTPSTVSKKGESVSQRMDREKPYAKRMTGPLARKQGSRTASQVTRATEGPGEPQAVTMPRKTRKESFDVYDLILCHLLDEGYAETQEAAEAIMVNMSEDWRESIIEGTDPVTPPQKSERPTALPGETYEQRRKRMKPPQKPV